MKEWRPFKAAPFEKAPTNRTESVEVLVERPVYPTKTLPAD
ncbi:hypothetical protein ALT761_01011 [Alteromonas sp. 76-1]|jgi:hypothetical protein|uniref:Uncharacterized protein n=1 Tax=Alteromonas naphthalenivorans TaxID=715451 RepID=F5ZE94_ALTNA|nr:hypothetical protein ambt_13440 [Alteromonas naphthalenivorans]VEL96050.1 hypothetical protein ALT761_01011 [Alteromonas sp. 76-1]